MNTASPRTMTSPSSSAFSIDLDGLIIAGLAFGPQEGMPVLALHGWLDNAASFEVLAAAMPGTRLLAIDMPGHGLSGHRTVDAGYQIWDDLPQLVSLMDKLGWEQCVLLGHSRGAMIATLLAAAMSERVRALITLDGMVPFPAEDGDIVTQLRSFLLDRERLSKRAPRIFKSVEEFVERRSRAGEPTHIAARLANRALGQTGAGYVFRGDARLSGASALKLNLNQIEAVLKALEVPVLNIWATPNERLLKLMNSARQMARQHVADLATVDIAGHHHWHMEDEPARRIAGAIQEFLKRLG